MKMAFVFPGQGSQSVGMLQAVATESAVSKTFAEATQVLDYDTWALAATGPEEKLNNTFYTQPMLLTASIALWRLWQQRDGQAPLLMAGHSLGEYSALVCAGVLEFSDALTLVQTRAQCMQAAVPEGEGAMAALLGLKDEQVQTVCLAAAQEQVVEAVNFNAPGQVVIAGNSDAVERAITQAKAAGAKRALKLAVSVPSHCALMKPAAEQFNHALNNIRFHQATIPVLHNVDADSRSHPDDIRAALSAQLYQPVQWVQTMQALVAGSITDCVECGPGKVLSGLAKRIDKSITMHPVS